MRITLNQEEIEEAIEKLILDQVDVPDDIRIDIDLKATRGDEGYTAEIDLLPFDAPTNGTDRSVDPRIGVLNGAEGMSIADKTEEAIAESKLPRRRGRPAGAKNKPKPHRRLPDEPASEEADEPEAEDSTEAEAEVQDETQDEAEQVEQETEASDSDGGTNEGSNTEPTEPTEQPTEQPAEPDERAIDEVEAEAGEAPVTVQEDAQLADAQEDAQEPVDPVEPVSEPTPEPEAPAEEAPAEPAEPTEDTSESTPAPAPAPTRSLFGHVRTNNSNS